MKSYTDLYFQSPRAFLRKLEEDMKAISARTASLETLAETSLADLLAEYERLSLAIEQRVYGVAFDGSWSWTADSTTTRLTNVYPRESLPNGEYFCWTGPEPVTSVVLPLSRTKDMIANIHIMKAQNDKMLTDLTITVNGDRAPHSITGNLITFKIPARLRQAARFTDVTINTGFVESPSKKDGSSDTRDLGLAIFSINVAPMSPEQV